MEEIALGENIGSSPPAAARRAKIADDDFVPHRQAALGGLFRFDIPVRSSFWYGTYSMRQYALYSHALHPSAFRPLLNSLRALGQT